VPCLVHGIYLGEISGLNSDHVGKVVSHKILDNIDTELGGELLSVKRKRALDLQESSAYPVPSEKFLSVDSDPVPLHVGNARYVGLESEWSLQVPCCGE
jgi:hypothetical protein